MNIAIHGVCGQMGRTVLQIAQQENKIHNIYGVDIQAGNLEIEVYRNLYDIPEKVDVIIDFSSPQSLQNILAFAIEKNIPIVLATTGFTSKQLAEINEIAKKIAIFKTANFSIGINVLEYLVEKTANILGNRFDIEIIEKHHNVKKDAPSGTAYMLAESVKKGFAKDMHFIYGREGIGNVREKNTIGIHAVRGGTIVGEHEVLFCGDDEIITLSHSARSKKIFAIGAIQAALFIHKKEAGLYNMQDILSTLFDIER